MTLHFITRGATASECVTCGNYEEGIHFFPPVSPHTDVTGSDTHAQIIQCEVQRRLMQSSKDPRFFRV